MSKFDGGYAIIDFKGIALSGTGVKITGVYNAIKAAIANYKPIMIVDVNATGLGKIPANFLNVMVSIDDQDKTVYWVGGFPRILEAGADSAVTFTYLTVEDDDTVTLKTAVYPSAG